MVKRVTMQISSGQGPDECELAVAKLFDALCAEFPDIELLDRSPGRLPGCFRSIRFTGDTALQSLEGSVQWICSSPYRPKHKRKNWYVDVSECAEADVIEISEDLIRFESFRASGKGGQHVNKTESAIRAVYQPTGDSVVIMNERSQHRNKQTAVEKLKQIIAERNLRQEGRARNHNWLENYRIVRGNPGRVYEGMDFKLRKGSQ